MAAVTARVCFVSAGPGAADLITLRGLQRLAQAEVVLFDALTDPALRAFAPQARWLDVGKRGFAHAAKQGEINALLVEQALSASGLVVRLKGGDASVFGRLEEELQALAAHGISSEVVPGVTAALAAAAETQRPLTRRGQGRSVSLTTAMTAVDPQAPASHPPPPGGADPASGGPARGRLALPVGPRADTEVFYMAGQQLPRLREQLLRAGWPEGTPVLAVSRAGCADACSSSHALQDLDSAALLHAGRPTVLTVGIGATAVTLESPFAAPATQANPEPLLKSRALSSPSLAQP